MADKTVADKTVAEKNTDRLRQYEKYLRKSRRLFRSLPDAGVCGQSGAPTGGPLCETEAVVSNYVLAPAISSFVLWVLQSAVRNGIQRLYFLARDGYLMYRTACILCEKLHFPVECRYLYCSRYSLRIPAYHLNLPEAMEYLCRGGIHVTRRKIIARSGLEGQSQKEALLALGYEENADEVVPYAELSDVRRELEQCREFQELLMKRSKAAMPALRGYLAQEGLLENVPSALVDSGWVGSMQKTLNSLLKQFGRTGELEGYYWGLYELPEDVRREAYHCYYFSPRKGLRAKVYFSNCLFEAVFSAPHGMTVGYRYENGKYVPALAHFSEDRKVFAENTERDLLRYAARYAEQLGKGRRRAGNEKHPGAPGRTCREVYPGAPGKTCREVYPGAPKRHRKCIFWSIDGGRDLKTVRKLMREFMGNPTREEALLYGALRFSDDMADDEGKRTAELLTQAELRANHVWNKLLTMSGIRRGYIKESAWYEGSAAIAGCGRKRHLRQYAMYKYLLYFRQSFLK